MIPARGSVRMKLLAPLAAAAVVTGVVVWLRFPAGRDALGAPGAEVAGAPPQRHEIAAPGTKDQPGTRAITPRAFSEAESAELGASGPMLEIEVVRADGTPAPRARLVLMRGDRLLGVKVTGDRGVAALPAGEGEADLFVLPDGGPTFSTRISIEPGRRRIELPGGVAITGRIEVVGEQPLEPLVLMAHGAGIHPVHDAAMGALGGVMSPICTASAGGEFELRDVVAGSEWGFQPLPVGYRIDQVLVGGRSVATVVAPAAGVLLRMTRLPVVRGRVVAGADRAPVPHALCTLMAFRPSGSMSQTSVARADGRFELAFVPGEDDGKGPRRVELTVLGPSQIGRKVVTLEPMPERDVDLGDVEVPSARTISYRVSDPAGRPIAGALARITDEVDLSSRTDGQGHGKIVVGQEIRSLVVGALRHEVVEVPIPAGPDPLAIVLQPTTGLEVRVVSREGPLHPAVFVRISAGAVYPFTGSSEKRWGNDPIVTGWGLDPIVTAAGGSANHLFSTREMNRATFTFSAAPSGGYVLAGLRAGVPIVVEAVDALERALATTTVTLDASEWKTIELTLTKPLRTLRGRVRDVTGKPVARAVAGIDTDPDGAGASMFWSPDSKKIAALTDAEGRFALSGFFDDVVHFGVDKPGYAPIVRRGFVLPADGVELDLTLRPGCGITVKAVLSGAAASGLQTRAEVEGYPAVLGEEKSPATYEFEDLPPDVHAKITFWSSNRTWSHVLVVKSGLVETVTLTPEDR